jgi:PAS domain S-box-containing protein
MPASVSPKSVQRTLRLLLVEDQEHDATLIVDQLRREGFELDWQRVDCEPDYLSRLDDSLDVILSDYRLPSFDVATALRLKRERHIDVPFIIISGTIGEERAVEALKQGADDYLLKDRLQRLGDAITKAMDRRTWQRDVKRAQAALEESERRHRLIFDNNPVPMWIFDLETYRFLEVNNAAISEYGYSREEFLGMTIFDIRQPEDGPRLREALSRPIRRFDRLGAYKQKKRDGSLVDVEITSHEIEFGGTPARVMLSNDITERRLAEIALVRNQQRTQFALSAGGIGIWDWDMKTGRTHWSETLERIHGLAPFTFGGTMKAFLECIHPEDRPAMQAELERTLFR